MSYTPSPRLVAFINRGTLPDTDREKSALLDECRSAFHQLNSSYKTLENSSLTQPTKKGRIVVHPPSAQNVQNSKDLIARHEAALASAPATGPMKPATILPRPAVKPAAAASKTPHLDAFAKLKGAEATTYYRAHSKEISIEQSMAHKPGIKNI